MKLKIQVHGKPYSYWVPSLVVLLLLYSSQKVSEYLLSQQGWKKYKNNSIVSRLLWSFGAGFVMIIGARLAGGCTSGHFLSGMSQIAISSMIFGAVVMIALVVTGKLFYHTKEQ